ncbi:MAG: hypothetical protein IID42_09965 [Planctomycetes bacterium]|nr:hypothetical protein [Planctomycetota bacterium]
MCCDSSLSTNDQARELPSAVGVEERWSELLDAETVIVQRQRVGPTMHSGVTDEG